MCIVTAEFTGVDTNNPNIPSISTTSSSNVGWESQKNSGKHQNPKHPSTKGGLQQGATNPRFCCGSSQQLFKDCTKKVLSCNNFKRTGHLAHMCNTGGESTANAEKALPNNNNNNSIAIEEKPKNVEFAHGTKKASAIKNSNKGMTDESIVDNARDVLTYESDEWLADSGVSRHIFNDILMLWNVRLLEKPVITKYCDNVH